MKAVSPLSLSLSSSLYLSPAPAQCKDVCGTPSFTVCVKRMIMPSRQLLLFMPARNLLPVHYWHSTADFYIVRCRGNIGGPGCPRKLARLAYRINFSTDFFANVNAK